LLVREETQTNGRLKMSKVIVVPAEKNTFKVLVNYIQRGVNYASKEIAENEASKIRAEQDVIMGLINHS